MGVDGFELVELASDIPAIETAQLIKVVEGALEDQPYFQLRVVGLSPEQRRLWIKRFCVEYVLDDGRHRMFAVKDTASR